MESIMQSIELITENGEARVDSRDIAERLGNTHQSTFELIKNYPEDFEEFGVLRFQTGKPSKESVGGRPGRYALLNEDQSYLLLSYSRNTKHVRKLKVALVKAFKAAREQAAIDTMMSMVLLPDAATWEKRFMDGFYEALSRMSGLPFNGHQRGTPPLFGKITHEWVYRVALHEEVYQEARSRCRPGDKTHQWLAPPALRAVETQLLSITSLANGCIDYQDFVSRCTRAYGQPGQLRLVYPAAA
jgi:phage regulator Rha-like protein